MSVNLSLKQKLFAIVEFGDAASALRVLHLPPASLELYGKKLVVRPREVKPWQRSGPPVSEEKSPPGDSDEQQAMEMEGGAVGSTPRHIGGVLLPQETAAAVQQAGSVSPKKVFTDYSEISDESLHWFPK